LAAIRERFFSNAGSMPAAICFFASSCRTRTSARLTCGEPPRSSVCFVEEAIFEALQLRAIGLDEDMKTLRISKAVGLGSRLCGVDLDLGQHDRFPAMPVSIRGHQKSIILAVLLVLLAAFRRTMSGDFCQTIP
jgi:hypothetical protein